jgi:hypothetical protein
MSRGRVVSAMGVAVAAAFVVATSVVCADTVELRGGSPPLEGEVIGATAAGVELKQGERRVTIAWSEVRAVRGDGLPAALDTWLDAGEALWRARLRVMRDDWPLADGAFAKAHEAWSGATPCADALFAAAGRSEGRLRAGDPAEAVAPAFEAIRLRRALGTNAAAAPGTAATDAMRLVDARAADPAVPIPRLVPPMGLAPAEAARARESLGAFAAPQDAGLERVVRAWAAVVGADAPPPAGAGQKFEADVRLALSALEAVRASQSRDPVERAGGLGALARARRSMPAWFEPWARFATGAALLRDADPVQRARGEVLLASIVAADATDEPMLAARATALREAPGARDGSVTDALASGASRPDLAVPRDRADRTASYLESIGRLDLVLAHLEQQAELELEGPARQAVLERMAATLARLLEREQDAVAREALTERADALVRRLDPEDPASDALRLALVRARYRAAQRAAEDWRAGRGDRAAPQALLGQFGELVSDFTALTARAGQSHRRAEQDVERSIGADASRTERVADRAEDVMRSAQFFRAWSGYYAAWLGRECGDPGWRDRAGSAIGWFSSLIEPDKAAISPADVSVDLRSKEGFASAILGMALASGLVQAPATADAWMALLDEPRTHPSIRTRVPAWRMALVAARGDLAAAAALLVAEGDGPQGVPMALIGAAAAARSADAAAAAPLLTDSVARLASAGRLRDLALVGAMPTAGTGPGASLFAAVQATSDAGRLQAAGDESGARVAWDRAAVAISGATGADAPASIAAGARALEGHILRNAGRSREAGESFLLAAAPLSGDRAGDVRWLAVLSFDEASRAPGQQALAARASATADAIVRELPATSAAVRARAWRVTRAESPATEDIDALLGGSVPAELAPAARRAAVDGLYRRFRSSGGDERRAAARRALAAGDDEPVGAGSEGVLELRRRIEMAIALDDAVRASDALMLLAARVERPAPALVDEMSARRAQVAALEGRLDDARREAASLDPAGPWGRVASASLLAAVVRSPEATDALRAEVARAVVKGQPQPGASETCAWLHAEAGLARAGGGGFDRAGALEAALQVRAAPGGSVTVMLAEADLRGATGDRAGEATLLRDVLSRERTGSDAWFEAKAMQVEALAASDPARARAMLEQVRQLASGFGDGPVADRLRALDVRLPKPGKGGGT